jgi:hypothetical protein
MKQNHLKLDLGRYEQPRGHRLVQNTWTMKRNLESRISRFLAATDAGAKGAAPSRKHGEFSAKVFGIPPPLWLPRQRDPFQLIAAINFPSATWLISCTGIIKPQATLCQRCVN